MVTATDQMKLLKMFGSIAQKISFIKTKPPRIDSRKRATETNTQLVNELTELLKIEKQIELARTLKGLTQPVKKKKVKR